MAQKPGCNEALRGAEHALIAGAEFPDMFSNPSVTIQEWKFQYSLRKSKCSYQSIRSALQSMVFPSFAALMLLYLGAMQITLHQEVLIPSDLKQIVQNDRLCALQHTNAEPDDRDDNRDESNSASFGKGLLTLLSCRAKLGILPDSLAE